MAWLEMNEERVNDALVQAREEGCDPAAVEAIAVEVAQARKIEDVAQRDAALGRLMDRLEALPVRSDFPYEEPSDLSGIEAARPKIALPQRPVPKGPTLFDRIYGAWLGRAAGCQLGRPVEGSPRDKIEKALRRVKAYPLADYFPYAPSLPKALQWNRAERWELRGGITKAMRDDDLDYPVLGLVALESKGPALTADGIAATWLDRMPYRCVYGAECAAYQNLVNGMRPPRTAMYRNPWREWIGAQIRADIWGYVHPGRSREAAGLAFADASLSATKNGIYGEMFFAAVIARSLVTDDLAEVVQAGLSVIPARSRFTEMVHDVLAWKTEARDWRALWDRAMAKYGRYHWVHTINNAAVLLIALLFSEGSLEKAITIAVMGGLDTDCNGATAGSILGAMLGAKRLPKKWTGPLHDRCDTMVGGIGEARISALARRATCLAEKLAKTR